MMVGMTIGDRGRRRFVLAVAVLQVLQVGWVATFLLVVLPRADPPFVEPDVSRAPDLLAMAFVVSGLLVVAVLLVRRHPRHGLLPALVVLPTVLLAQYVFQGWGATAERYGGPGLLLVRWASNWVWLGVAAALVVLLLRFPTGTALGRGWRRYEAVALAHTGLVAALFAAVPKLPGTDADYPVNPFGWSGLRGWDAVLEVLFGMLGVHLLVGLAALGVRFRRGTAEERQQLRWVGTGAAALLVAVGSEYLLDAPTAVVAAGVAALVASIAVAVLRYRLWELGLVLRRTLVYAMLSTLLVVAYVGLVLALRRVVTADLVPELLVTALVAVAALPLRTVLQRAVDRMLFGDRRDPYALVRSLGRRTADGAGAALPGALREIADGLRLPGAAVVLADGSGSATHGSVDVEGARIPLTHHGVRVAELIVARRHPAEPLTRADLRLLDDVAGHLAATVQSDVLDEAVRRSQARLVGVREAERARLRRDLHDEMGPLLGAVGLRVRAARNLLAATDPPLHRIETVLDAAAGDVGRALAEVQRIVADLRPGALDGRGLLDALRAYASGWAGTLDVRLDLPERLPVLDPAVETAAYRIAVEGLHNAEKHSGGTTATLRLVVHDERLDLAVTDDGCGLAAPPERGVGLGSMRERARIVGGTLWLEPVGTGGLSVRGRLPLVLR